MESIKSNNCKIFFGKDSYSSLNQHIIEKDYSSIFILVDDNTIKNCLPYFQNKIFKHKNTNTIAISSGEINKHIKTCLFIWKKLSELSCDRKSLIINLGGGVITDIGGFIASTFKRGVDYINIPTTLLSMVDASIGGKTGVDLGVLKNQIGIINNPKIVLIDDSYLITLPDNEFRSGYAEMLKHGLISDKKYWIKLSNIDKIDKKNILSDIKHSVEIKNQIVLKDPFEKSIRKILNFGHTLGHAIESYFLSNNNKTTLLHGESIAVGMILEAFISSKLSNLSYKEVCEIKDTFNSIYSKVDFTEKDIDSIIELIISDKKNSHGIINFVLLNKISSPLIDVQVKTRLIKDAFQYYLK